MLSKAATQLVDPIGIGREYKVMGMTAAVANAVDNDAMWPFIADEIQEEDAAASQAQHLSHDVRGAGVSVCW